MFSFTMEFDSQEQLRECVDMLKSRYSFAGELSVRPMEDGTWRMTAFSEKRFRNSTFEKLPGRRADE